MGKNILVADINHNNSAYADAFQDTIIADCKEQIDKFTDKLADKPANYNTTR